MTNIFLALALILLTSTQALADTKCFLATEQNRRLRQEGQCMQRHSPCSTFKIAISLMGYNEAILIDETHPEWPFKEGYVDWVDVWKQPHNPTTWMKNSCVWYSQVVTTRLGMAKFINYVNRFDYGNRNVSGDKSKNNGLTYSWLGSSLQISPQEQVTFLQKLIANQLPVSMKAQMLTKNILFVEDLGGGWTLYGKTGSGPLPNEPEDKPSQMGWFVGWAQKGPRTIVFAHYMEDEYKVGAPPAGKRAKDIAIENLRPLIMS